MAGEARDPKRDMPRAVLLSVTGTALFTLLAGVGLVGMQYYTDIDSDAGFEKGFERHGWRWAAAITSWGELVTLPVVIFVCILPQARLFYAMALDGLLPKFFAQLWGKGVLLQGNLFIGMLGLLQAMLVDFDTIADLTSAGVLLSFVLCNCSLIMMTLTRPAATQDSFASSEPAVEPPTQDSLARSESAAEDLSPERARMGRALAVFCLASFACMVFLAGLLLPSTVLGLLSTAPPGVKAAFAVLTAVLGLLALGALALLASKPHSSWFGSIWVPAAGILFNCFMLSTLAQQAFYQFAGTFVLVLIFYFTYGLRHSAGNNERWERKSLIVESPQPPREEPSAAAAP